MFFNAKYYSPFGKYWYYYKYSQDGSRIRIKTGPPAFNGALGNSIGAKAGRRILY